MSIEGKIALVTGATRGIGKAIALALAKQNAVVVGTATSDAGAQAIADYLQQANANGKGYALNVADKDSIERFMQQLKADFGDPAILINNAGITRDNIFMRMKDEEWSAVLETNLSSVFHMCKAVVRPMIKARWGRIVNIGSVVGTMGNGGQVNYSASKAGLLGLTKSLAKEIGSRGITVNAVAPGFIQTDMTASLTDEQREKVANGVALQRLGTVEDIAQAVMFLVMESGSYITGETIHVNGGMHMA